MEQAQLNTYINGSYVGGFVVLCSGLLIVLSNERGTALGELETSLPERIAITVEFFWP